MPTDAFCALSELPDLDEKIAATELALKAAQDQTSVQSATIFASIELPGFDIEAIQDTLGKDLPDLDRSAEARVQAHIGVLGEGGEPWVADGVLRAEERGDCRCPFCGQNMGAVALITHYRAYFSQEYTRLKQTVSRLINDIDRNHTDRKHLEFERSIGTLMQSQGFWTSYCNVPTIEIDTKAIVDDRNSARNAVADLLKGKRDSPLEAQVLNQPTLDALNAYNGRKHAVSLVNQMLLETNETIQKVKQQAGTADTGQITAALNRLKATKSRFREDIAQLCNAYLDELAAKAYTETTRNNVREELEEYRSNVFPKLQDGVNGYLERFNAGFRVGSLAPANIGSGSGSTCTCNVVINELPIAVRSSDSPSGEPSFRNALSAGDRSTLALALFFSSLDSNPNLSETVVVVDDPMSSLDDHRSLATVQAIREFSRRTKQAIILSHNKRFLCGILDGMRRGDEYTTLEMAPMGHESTIRNWDASQDSITEHDQRYFLLH